MQINKRSRASETGRSCPVCKTYSFSMSDDVYMSRFECCFECYVQHVEGREERWSDGWRPDKNTKAIMKQQDYLYLFNLWLFISCNLCRLGC